jgi:hypothetical protein
MIAPEGKNVPFVVIGVVITAFPNRRQRNEAAAAWTRRCREKNRQNDTPQQWSRRNGPDAANDETWNGTFKDESAQYRERQSCPSQNPPGKRNALTKGVGQSSFLGPRVYPTEKRP